MKKVYISIGLLIGLWLVHVCVLENLTQATIIWGINSIFYLAFPLIYILSKKKTDQNTLKKLAFWNSFAIAGLSMINVYENIDNNDTGILTFVIIIALGIVYFFINYCLYLNDSRINTDKEEKSYKKRKESINSSAKKEEFDMNRKYNDLKKLKELLDNDVITKDEFEKEKKKILK